MMGVIDSSLDEDEAWERISLAPLMATLLLPIIIGVILIVKCVFGNCCKKSATKDEMYGLEGRMTILSNSDAAFLTSPSASSANFVHIAERVSTPRPMSLNISNVADNGRKEDAKVSLKSTLKNNTPDMVVNDASHLQSSEFPTFHRSDHDISDSLKRNTGKRQLPELPELPHLLRHPPRRSSSVLSHDGTSDLYATVGEVANVPSTTGLVNPYTQLKIRHSVPNDCQPSTSRGLRIEHHQAPLEPNPSSDSETYATNNHPYAKLKRNLAEHPYARVGTTSVGNDEETDTDNYDLPQSYAQAGSRATSGVEPIGNGGAIVDNSSQRPVPPRRIGRQWRRGSTPQAQNGLDSANFSGDSQDSRGYTSISVREPLSNIRNQMPPGRSGDSHYATVSDDSEEMYAAIDDSSEGNYMQISEGERPCRPLWIDAANVASPIPERREANSPLPPVPPIFPPPSENNAGPPISPHLVIQHPPVYAQVSKKSKKSKAPATPTTSNASSSSQTYIRDIDTVDNTASGQQLASSILGPASNSHHSHSHHNRHRRSKSRTLMDNTNLLEAEHRRWSKADISYSEFEVVREPSIPSFSEQHKSPVDGVPDKPLHLPISPRNSLTGKLSSEHEVIDEDNYNVIIDDRVNFHIQVEGRNSSVQNRFDTNYQSVSNPYQEIEGKDSLDHYQVIPGDRSGINDGYDNNGSGLYQEIRKPEDEEDEEDEFYERVKPVSKTLSVPCSLISNKKHGYEKIKKKEKEAKAKNVSDEEGDEDEVGGAEEDLMYERVKYPPYERLKESRSDLAVDDDDEGSNFYEHIGYSRVKQNSKFSSSGLDQQSSSNPIIQHDDDDADLHQLYAVVDKTKKKSKISESSSINNNNNPQQNHNNNNPLLESSNLVSNSTIVAPSSPDNSVSHTNLVICKTSKGLSLHAGPDLEFIDDTNDVEYI